MRWLVLAVCACNQVYSLDPTQLVDAPPIDAPFRCIVPGPATYAVAPHQVDVGPIACFDYTRVGNRVIAVCFAAHSVTLLPYEGIGDDLLAPAKGIVVPNGLKVRTVRLTPEGDELYVQLDGTSETVTRYQRSAGMWIAAGNVSLPLGLNARIGTLTAGAGSRHMLLVTDDKLHELAESGAGNWVDLLPTYVAELGALIPTYATMTTDGLRLVVRTTTGVFYMERDQIDRRFGLPVRLANVPPVADPFMTDDCSRVYGSAGDVQAVFYFQQL
jgi:hypothetical protein